MPVTQYTLGNAKNIPLNLQTGSIPNMGVSLLDWFQYITFGQVTKVVEGFQVKETVTDVSFWGIIQPLTERQLILKPEGQRAWTWFDLYVQASPAGAVISLNVDDVVIWNQKQTRVMGRKDYALYGFTEMSLVQDWTNSGPPTP